MCRMIAIANRKGGSGKTATAVNLSACLADMGFKCLLVDLDPQSHATLSVGIQPYRLKQSISNLLVDNQAEASDLVQRTAFYGLDIIPASFRLEEIAGEIGDGFPAETVLAEKLEPITALYDFIIFDCPAMMGALLKNGLAAARALIVPLQTHFLAMEGLAQITRLVYSINANLNPELRLIGVVPTLSNIQTRLARSILAEVSQTFGEAFLFPTIRMDIRLAEAPSYGQPIIHYAPGSNGAHDYRKLADTVSTINCIDFSHQTP